MYQQRNMNGVIPWFWFELNVCILVFNTDIAQFKGEQ